MPQKSEGLGPPAPANRGAGVFVGYALALVFVILRCVAEIRGGGLGPAEMLALGLASSFVLALGSSVSVHAAAHPASPAFSRASIVFGLWLVTTRIVFPELAPLGFAPFDVLLALRPIVAALTVSALAHQVLVFPDLHPWIRGRRRLVFGVVYGQAFLYLGDDWLTLLGEPALAAPLEIVAQVSGVWVLGGVVALAAGRRRAGLSAEGRRHLTWIAIGTVVAVVPPTLLMVVPVHLFHRLPPLGALPLLSVLGFPVAAGVAILRDRALEADLELRRALATLAGTVLMGGGFMVVAAAVAQVLSTSPTPPSLAMAVLGTALAAVLLLRVGLQGYRRLDRLFDRQRFHDRSLLERLASELPTAPSAADLARRLAVALPDALAVRGASLLIGEAELRDPLDNSVRLPANAQGIAERCRASGRVLLRSEPSGGPDLVDLPDRDRTLVVDRQVAGVVPVKVDGGLVGVVLVGVPRSGRRLDAEDAAVLRTIASQVAVAFVNGRLVESERRTAAYHRNVLAGIATGVVVIDSKGAVTSVNRAARELMKLNEETPDELRRSLGVFQDAIDSASSGRGDSSGEVEVGGRRVAFRAEPLEAPGAALGIQLILDDVTERRRLEKVSQVRSKLEALGQFAGHIVHDIGNVGAEVDGVLARLRSRVRGEPELAEALAEVQQRIRRIDDLVRIQREFVRGSRTRRELVDLREVVLGALGSVRRSESLIVRREPWDDGSWVLGDPDQLRRMVENLTRNAVQAMGDGGELRLGVLGGDEVVLEVSDTGPGIPTERREDLFDPFCTSKPGGQGLGLSFVLDVVTAHGGRIDFDSNPDRGTTFRVCFPRPPLSGKSGEGVEIS